MQPLVEFRSVEVELLSVGAVMRDLAGTGELVEVAFAEFKVQAGFLEVEDFFLEKGLAQEQFLDAVEFGKDIGLVVHAL